MTVLRAEEVKKLVLEGLPDWIEEHPELRRRLRETIGEIPRQSPQKMTYEEFLAWADEDTLAEWVDGEVVMYSPASKQHQDITSFLYEVIRAYVQSRRLGEIIQAPFQMKLEYGREPDLLFVAQEHLERLKETYLDGPADLAVEIVSPESLDRDRGAKFAEYEAGGVSEYWLLDPLRRWAEFYRLGEEGRYSASPGPDCQGGYRGSRAFLAGVGRGMTCPNRDTLPTNWGWACVVCTRPSNSEDCRPNMGAKPSVASG
jgi:Uma2 family endonuclease